ncbi:MAG: tetratricopeptide repeat protein, partial [candidate division WOR-3 bacterium]
FSAGYKMKTAEIPVKTGADMDFTISLSKVINPVVKQSMDLTKEAANYYKRGLLNQAKQKLEEALNLYPNNKQAKKGLQMVSDAFAENIGNLRAQARAKENAGDIRGAISIWEQVAALEENPSSTQAHIRTLRNRLTASTRRTPARTTPRTTTTSRAPARTTPSLSKQQIADLYTKGLSAYFDGNYKEAIRYFEQVLRADPSHAQAKRYLGEAKKH